MREFAFEAALCAHIEEATDWLPARQLGAAVADPGSRVMDVVCVVPGDEFERRAAITGREIPARAVEADVGRGRAVHWREAVGGRADRARAVVDRAVEVGFFEEERRDGRRYVRRAVRYPEDWFARLVGVENKPDLGTPGDLQRQLRLDAALGLFDRVVLATESYVTRAHLNRLPDVVGVWRFDPETGAREVVREADPLPVAATGVEIAAEHPLRTDVALVSEAQKARRRRRIAERAYGKGWRTWAWPACARASATADGRPRCAHFGRVVDPGSECGTDCPGHDPADPADVDAAGLRDARTPWRRDPAGVARRQSGLDRFG